MKKILATLLVATMLLSCISFVGFAANPTVFLPSNMLGSELYTEVDGYYDSEALWHYIGFVKAQKSITDRNQGTFVTSGRDPLYTSLYNSIAETGKIAAIDAKTESYVQIPVYTEGEFGLCSIEANIEYDSKLFSPVLVTAYEGSTTLSLDTNNNNMPKIVYANPVAASGFVTAVYFEVNDSAVGNANGEAIGTFKLANIKARGATDDSIIDPASVVMTVAISGLTPGAEEEQAPVDIVVGDLTGTATKVAAQTQIAIAPDTELTDILGATITETEGDDVTGAEAYSAVFAAIDLTGKNAPEAYGFAVIDKNGVAPTRIFEAKKVYGGKFGVAFFGTAEVLNWYKAAPAVKVNGTWIYDVNKASNL